MRARGARGRVTLFNLLVGINGCTLRRKESMHAGYPAHRNRKLGSLILAFIDALTRCAVGAGRAGKRG